MAPSGDAVLGAIRPRRRQLARGAYDHETVSPLFPWTTNPNIYIRTIDATGRSIEPEVLSHHDVHYASEYERLQQILVTDAGAEPALHFYKTPRLPG